MISRSQEDWKGRLVSSVGQDMRAERWTDLILYSSEGIPVPVHRAILSQSPHLRPLLTSLSCCQGRCNHQEPLTLLLPDVPYRLLITAVTFLYTGTIQSSMKDRQAVKVCMLHHYCPCYPTSISQLQLKFSDCLYETNINRLRGRDINI